MQKHSYVDRILVIFHSQKRVVGWYHNATVFAELQKPNNEALSYRGNAFDYNLRADIPDALLLPDDNREWRIKSGKGGPGQANVFYPPEDVSAPENQWIEQIYQSIAQYDGNNLFEASGSQFEDEAGLEAAQQFRESAASQGYVIDGELRRMIERHAEKLAIKHFKKKNWSCEQVGKPYDLRLKRGNEIHYVEIKGTCGDGQEIILTPNEVDFALRHRNQISLVVVVNIELCNYASGPKPKGGCLRVVYPWCPQEYRLKPMGYRYRFS